MADNWRPKAGGATASIPLKQASTGTWYAPSRSDAEETKVWQGVSRGPLPSPITEDEQARMNAEPSAVSKFLRFVASSVDPKTPFRRRLKATNALYNKLSGQGYKNGTYEYGGWGKIFDGNAPAADRWKAAKEVAADWYTADQGGTWDETFNTFGWEPKSKLGAHVRGYAAAGMEELTDPVNYALAFLGLSGAPAAASAAKVGVPAIIAASQVPGTLKYAADYIDTPQESNNKINEAITERYQKSDGKDSQAINALWDAINEE